MAPPRFSEAETTTRLIEKAIRGLSERDRSRVMRFLLRGWLDLRTIEQPPGVLRRALAEADLPTVEFAPPTPVMTIVSSGPEHQTLPVRLPDEQHARLKEWCSEHGFSMATVIRGLVENFLKAQGRPATERPS